MNKRNPRSYDKEFKLNAIKLYLESGRSYKQIGDELGVPEATLAGSVGDDKKDGAHCFPGKVNQKPANEELTLLRKELAIAREERDRLKKALGIFSSTKK